MARMKSPILFAALVALCFLVPPAAQALPSHFGDKVENALACRSEWSPAFWRTYFRQHLNAPIRVWGEAEWFGGQQATMAGNQVEEFFVNVPESGALMVGALINKPLEQVKKNVEEKMGFAFVELPGPYPRWLSKFGSVLVASGPEQTKWYCARWHLGNRP
ncbi:hypothetical protein [Chitinibacter tainanensis]|uniref:hypothetical protein n=1 Tax=Chitinibacter tainanensis TaxID=230667 RepID=UPI002353F039|nr:hypothetical protein [Chitinibacter tainanensis]